MAHFFTNRPLRRWSIPFLNRIPVDGFVTLLGIAGLILFITMYSSAFPSAALKIPLSRGEITRLANDYISKKGYDLSGYQFALNFQSNSFASIFLQRTVGIVETNRLVTENNLPLWNWHARWFRPMQKEEFSLDLLPDGRLSGFSHTIDEADPGAAIPQEEAQALAKTYLQQQGWDLSAWEPTSASSSDLPARRDHSFGWKRKGFSVGDSEIQLSVSVQGNRIGYFSYWFKVPEKFSRQFSIDRNLPNLINNIAYNLGLVLSAAIAILFLVFPLIQHINPFRKGMVIPLLSGLVVLLTFLNDLSYGSAYYPTTQDWTLFWLGRVTNAFMAGMAFTGLMLFILAGGRYIARLAWPLEDKILPRGADRWGILARSSWRGFMLGGLQLGYVILFYFAAVQIFGAWSPADVDYSSGFATPLPFMDPLYFGLRAASLEETLFRLVAISLIYWLTHKKWLALIIPGILFAFAHLSYITDPFYLRGIEIMLPAILIDGLFFFTFDLTTTIMAHMTYNALLGTLPMLRSSDPYLVFSGCVVVAVLLSPTVVGLLGSWRNRRKRAADAAPRIRPAELADLPGLHAQPFQMLDWPALLQEPNAGVVILESGPQVVGVAAGVVTSQGTAELLGVYVDPQWREQFWGSRLVEALWKRLAAQGAAQLDARVPSSAYPAYAFLSVQGWQTSERILTRQEGTPVGSWARKTYQGTQQEVAQILNKIKQGTQKLWPKSSTKS